MDIIVLFSFVKKNYMLGKGSIKRWMIVDLKDSTHDTLKAARKPPKNIWGMLVHLSLGSVPGRCAWVDHDHDLVVRRVVVEWIGGLENLLVHLKRVDSDHVVKIPRQCDELGSGRVVLLLLALEHLHHEHLHHHPLLVQHRLKVPVLVVRLGEDDLVWSPVASICTRRKCLIREVRVLLCSIDITSAADGTISTAFLNSSFAFSFVGYSRKVASKTPESVSAWFSVR